MLNNTIVLGTSFSPEYAKYIGSRDPLDLLKVINRDLGIDDIRLGLRWNVVQKDKEISLDFYDKYLEYLFKNNCKVCLNVGPIKVFRWPEDHIPKDIEVKESIVTPDSDIAKYSYEYLDNLLTLLKQKYGNRLDDVMFQLENEAFFKFGRLRITMSKEYLLSLTEILRSHFPNNRVMFNSAGRKNLKSVVELFKDISDKGIYTPQSLVLGFNYYFKLPNIPTKDPITSFSLLSMSIKKLHRYQKEMGFGLEISEGQFEPWGKQKTPGNSYSDYEYLLEKCKRYFPNDYQYKLLRLWGTEELALKIFKDTLEDEHKRIIASILEK
ncbi:MAG: hypothetical protein RBS01_02440 [Candidatus Dojkabacteria bacterium]|jgi:hypothetical protein|nr:hypothetical protein [Candidatus Dojkabacteria bacterium]